MAMPVIAICTRCGRRFVTEPAGGIDGWRDGYAPIAASGLTDRICGGKVELVAVRREASR